MFKLTFKTLKINALPLFPYNEFDRKKFCYLGSVFLGYLHNRLCALLVSS